jgi:hypothetical protein
MGRSSDKFIDTVAMALQDDLRQLTTADRLFPSVRRSLPDRGLDVY